MILAPCSATLKAKPCGRPWRAGLDRACARRMSRIRPGRRNGHQREPRNWRDEDRSADDVAAMHSTPSPPRSARS